MTPTTSDAITAPIHSCRFQSASGVMPLGQPRPKTSDQLHPLSVTASVPSTPASTASRSRREPAERLPNKPCERPGPRGVTVAPPESQAGTDSKHVEYYAA